MKRLGILLSGRGSNFEAIAVNIAAGSIDAQIAVVIGNRTVAAAPLSGARRTPTMKGETTLRTPGVAEHLRAPMETELTHLTKDRQRQLKQDDRFLSHGRRPARLSRCGGRTRPARVIARRFSTLSTCRAVTTQPAKDDGPFHLHLVRAGHARPLRSRTGPSWLNSDSTTAGVRTLGSAGPESCSTGGGRVFESPGRRSLRMEYR